MVTIANIRNQLWCAAPDSMADTTDTQQSDQSDAERGASSATSYKHIWNNMHGKTSKDRATHVLMLTQACSTQPPGHGTAGV
jgi:hypothetical protein